MCAVVVVDDLTNETNTGSTYMTPIVLHFSQIKLREHGITNHQFNDTVCYKTSSFCLAHISQLLIKLLRFHSAQKSDVPLNKIPRENIKRLF